MNNNLAYPEYIADEMINGKIIMMSPRALINHNRIAFNIARLFANHLEGRTCEAIADGTDLFLTEKDRFVPDVMVVCDPKKLKYNGVHGAPDLVVEVLSPRTAKNDRLYKKNVYEKCGVKEYWLVDPNNKTVEQYILQDNQLVLQQIYFLQPHLQEVLTDEECAAYPKEFKCSLYDDLIIKLDAVFARVD